MKNCVGRIMVSLLALLPHSLGFEYQPGFCLCGVGMCRFIPNNAEQLHAYVSFFFLYRVLNMLIWLFARGVNKQLHHDVIY